MSRRDLFVSTFSPRLGNGRDLRTYTVIKALAANGPLDVLYVAHGGEPADELRAIDSITLHEVIPSRGLSRGLTALATRARGWSTATARSCSVEVRREATRMALAPECGRVIAGDLNVMSMLMSLARRRPIIYNAHNIESSYGTNPYIGRFHWLPLAYMERRVLDVAAESWMVSHIDVERARAMAPGAALRYVPNVVDVQAIDPVPAPGPGDAILMIADFTYPPNRESVEWLLEAVMPRVWDARPRATLRLTGKGLELPDADPRVEVTGFVDDLADAYAAANVAVVPLVEGAGTPLKFVEALAQGVPVVATPLAARGLAVVPGEHFRVGPDAAAFAREIVDVLDSGDPAMAGRARELAERDYSVETLVRLVVGPPSHPSPGGSAASVDHFEAHRQV